jgi:hypothetical protein
LNESKDKDCNSIEYINRFYDSLCNSKDEEIKSLQTSFQRQTKHISKIEKLCFILRERLDLYEKENDKKAADNTILNNPHYAYVSRESKQGYSRDDLLIFIDEIKQLREENTFFRTKNLELNEAIESLNKKYIDQTNQTKKQKYCLQKKFKLSENLNTQEIDKKAESNSINTDLEALKSIIVKENLNDFKTTSPDQCTQDNRKLKKRNNSIAKKQNLRKLEKKLHKLFVFKAKNGELRIKNKDQSMNSKHDSNSYSVDIDKNNFKASHYVKKKTYDKLLIIKTDLEVKYDKIKYENNKLASENNLLEAKVKQIKNQIENHQSEIGHLKKREQEFSEKETTYKKQEEDAKEAIKKTYESKIKTLNYDLKKQANTTKNFKSEIENLNDKIKSFNEKVSHLERDNTQKKQLLEFYKKKLEESNTIQLNNSNEKNVNELRIQLKKQTLICEQSNEKLKVNSFITGGEYLFGIFLKSDISVIFKDLFKI